MIVLNATTQSLEILMSAAADTTNPAFMTAYADNTGSVFTEGNHSGALNGTTAVTVVAAPGASTRRMVKEICVFNDDAAEVTITLRLNNNGTYRNLAQANIAPNGSWRWTKPPGAKGDKGETGAAIVSAAFSGDDLVFTKDDTNTVTLADAKIDLKGDTGTAGKTWHNGSGAPGDGTGVDGDFYLDTAADAYYGPKAAGTWTGTGPTSLIGPDGDMTNPMTTQDDIIVGGASGAPARLAIAEQRIVGRITGGNVAGLTAAQVMTLLKAMPAGSYELTDGATIAIDWDNGSTQYVVLGATGRTVTFANPVSGQVYRFIVIQNEIGSRTITTWPTIKWAGGAAPTLSTTAAYIDIVTLLYVNSVYYGDCAFDFRTPA